MTNSIPCGYCGGEAKFCETSTHIYRRDYGPVYDCRPCDAYVGVHKGSKRAKGSVANKDLRELRKLAHTMFDPLWRRDGMTRDQAYEHLAEVFGREVHIGQSDEETCRQIIRLFTTGEVPA